MIDFGAMPPEYNSGRMYAGPGPDSLMVAASAWNGLAAELNSAARAYSKIIATLTTEEWMGSASASMAQAVAPHVAWISTTAAQAEQAASQLQAAVAAYETALSSTVPPPLVAANRADAAQLLATNVVGQNTPAIMGLEAEYGEMWAQDASAMFGYAAQSAAATEVKPFAAAPQIANPDAEATQGGAVAKTTQGSAQSVLAKSISATPNTLKSLASPTSTTATDPLTELWYLISGQSTLPNNLGTLINGYSPYSALWYNTEGLPYFSVGMGNFGVQIAKSMGLLGGAASAAKPATGLSGLDGLMRGGGAVAHATAALGNAPSIGGKLSVPVAWPGASAPTAPDLGRPVPVVTVGTTSGGAGGHGNLLGGMPLAGAGPSGRGGTGPRYGFRPTVMARPPFAG